MANGITDSDCRPEDNQTRLKSSMPALSLLGAAFATVALHPVPKTPSLVFSWDRRCVMERRKFRREFKLEAVRLIKDRGVSYVQASQDLGVHTSQLRDWVKKLADDPQHAFPGQGQMKPEQLEIARLKREVTKLKAERDILKKAAAYFAKEST